MFSDRMTDSMNIWLISIIRKVMLELSNLTKVVFFFSYKYIKKILHFLVLLNYPSFHPESSGRSFFISRWDWRPDGI